MQEDRQVNRYYFEQGKPMPNGIVENLNGWMYNDLFNERLLKNRRRACTLAAARHAEFSKQRPHSSLAGLMPTEHANRSKNEQN